MSSKPKLRNRIFTIVAVILVLLVVFYLAICTYAILEVTKTGSDENPKPLEPTPADFGLNYMDVRFPARNDGLEIAGWFIPNEGSDNAIILVHGRHENRASAMEGTYPQFAAALHEAGFAVLMIDVRGHGQSAPARYDFGLKAKNDVLGAVDWLLAQGFPHGYIGAMGISLGGGAVNYAAAEEPAIGAIVGDSTYSDLNPIIEAQWQEESGLPNFFLPGVFLMHRILFGFDLQDAVPLEAIRTSEPRPYLVVHCKVDDMVSIDQAEAMAAAVPNADFWYIEDGCEHAQINTVMPEEYEAHIIPFFVKSLP
jgi:fermentation-respiration switch protein FrsA (DUF1100 family)